MEEYGIKVIVNGEQYEAYKGTLQDQINELQERIDKVIEYIDKYEIIDQVDYDIKPVLEEVIKPILKGE